MSDNVGFSSIYISQASVATQLRCGGMFNNHFIANCLQNVPEKNLGKFEDMDNKKCDIFGIQCILFIRPLKLLLLSLIARKKCDFNEFLQFRNHGIGKLPIPGFGIDENGRHPGFPNFGIAIPVFNVE